MKTETVEKSWMTINAEFTFKLFWTFCILFVQKFIPPYLRKAVECIRSTFDPRVAEYEWEEESSIDA